MGFFTFALGVKSRGTKDELVMGEPSRLPPSWFLPNKSQTIRHSVFLDIQGLNFFVFYKNANF